MSLTSEFLSQKRIAVVGVSRDAAKHGANYVYRRLRDRGYEVFAVNPNAAEVEGVHCYPDLASIPGGVEAVVIGTAPERADAVVRECHALGIGRVWMHQGPVPGSVSETAARYCRENGISVIAGGCPLMFGPSADLGHRCMKWFMQARRAMPRGI